MIISESLLKQIIREETQIVLQESKGKIFSLLKALFKKSAKKKGAGIAGVLTPAKRRALKNASEELANSSNQLAVQSAIASKDGKKLVSLAKDAIAQKGAVKAGINITGKNYRNVIDDVLRGSGPNAREVLRALGPDGANRMAKMLKELDRIADLAAMSRKNRGVWTILTKGAIGAIGGFLIIAEGLNLSGATPVISGFYRTFRNWVLTELKNALGWLLPIDWFGTKLKDIRDYLKKAYNKFRSEEKKCIDLGKAVKELIKKNQKLNYTQAWYFNDCIDKKYIKHNKVTLPSRKK